MGFTALRPPEKVKHGIFKISSVPMRRKESSAWRLQITIPSVEFQKHFGNAEKFDLLMGDGPDAGILLIRATEQGAFAPTGLKNCFIFRLPVTPETPEIEFKGEDPERKMTSEGLKITLPNWAWEPGRWQEIQKARAIAGRQVAAEGKLNRKDALARIGGVKAT